MSPGALPPFSSRGFSGFCLFKWHWGGDWFATLPCACWKRETHFFGIQSWHWHYISLATICFLCLSPWRGGWSFCQNNLRFWGAEKGFGAQERGNRRRKNKGWRLGISGQKGRKPGNFRVKRRPETENIGLLRWKIPRFTAQTSEVWGKEVRGFEGSDGEFMVFPPHRSPKFVGYATKKCTFPPYRYREIYTKLSKWFKVEGNNGYAA